MQYNLFESSEEAWYWFVASTEAKKSGGAIDDKQKKLRPCETNDIYNIIMRLYMNRMLRIDHFRVLKFYGLRGAAPDPNVVSELKAHTLWVQAMDRLEPILIRRGIVKEKEGFLF